MFYLYHTANIKMMFVKQIHLTMADASFYWSQWTQQNVWSNAFLFIFCNSKILSVILHWSFSRCRKMNGRISTVRSLRASSDRCSPYTDEWFECMTRRITLANTLRRRLFSWESKLQRFCWGLRRGMVHGCGNLSGFTSDKLSSQSRIRHLAFIHLFAREEYRSK